MNIKDDVKVDNWSIEIEIDSKEPDAKANDNEPPRARATSIFEI